MVCPFCLKTKIAFNKKKWTDHNYISFTDLNVCFKILRVFSDNLQPEEMIQGITL